MRDEHSRTVDLARAVVPMTHGAGDTRAVDQESPAVIPGRLIIVPITLRCASEFVTAHHRHHKAPRGHKFSIGVTTEDGTLVGVAIVGRPVARALDDGQTAEVNRTCTTGYPNANSALYGAARRAAKAMGYRKLVTYTQEGESGASLRGAGWQPVAELPARGSWAASSGSEYAAKRDPEGAGGVARIRWEVAA